MTPTNKSTLAALRPHLEALAADESAPGELRAAAVTMLRYKPKPSRPDLSRPVDLPREEDEAWLTREQVLAALEEVDSTP